MNGPLADVLVVACEQAVAAPLATRHLADLGARVIKVERPDGGDFARSYDATVHGLSSHFVWLNRGKESVSLDLKTPEGAAALAALLARADVFVQNLAPGAITRLGFGADELARRHPSLITCDISGYAPDGPLRDAKAYDLLIQSEAGLLSVTGTEDSPAKSGVPAADIAAGMYAFSGVITALYERERTGRGTPVTVNLFDALIEWMGYPIYYTRYGGTAPARTGTSHPAIAPYGTVPCADGDVVVAIQNEREWRAFCTVVLDDADLASDPRFATGPDRVRNRAELDALIDHRAQTTSTADFTAMLDRAGVANARARRVEDVVRHPDLVQRGRWVPVETEAGPVEALLPPTTLPAHPARMGAVPRLGEHTEAVLAELGLSNSVNYSAESNGSVTVA